MTNIRFTLLLLLFPLAVFAQEADYSTTITTPTIYGTVQVIDTMYIDEWRDTTTIAPAAVPVLVARLYPAWQQGSDFFFLETCAIIPRHRILAFVPYRE
jgi:hypothetical protein